MKKFAIVGNPNTGKTTFFNTLTGANEHVGNWHGVTVDAAVREFTLDGQKAVITDLPGTYSMYPYSFEENVTLNYLLNNRDVTVINLCDALNLSRNLYLTLQLCELGFNVVLCVNGMGSHDFKFDAALLRQKLGIKVFVIEASDKSQIEDCLKKCDGRFDNFKSGYLEKFKIGEIQKILGTDKYSALKFLESGFTECALPEKREAAKKLFEGQNDVQADIAKARYAYVNEILKFCNYRKDQKYARLCKIDKIVLNRFLALPIFVLVMCLVFFITFGPVGTFLTRVFEYVFGTLFEIFMKFLQNFVSSSFALSFINDAVLGSLLSVIVFIPQIALLFMCLSFLEYSGYMGRIAFVFEDVMRRVGLTGRSVFTLLMSFGCSATATLTARNLEDDATHKKTVMLTSYMSCSAKLPVYAVICGAFFARGQTLIVIGMYFLAVAVAMLVAFFLEKTVLKSGEQSFIMELPNYEMPKARQILKNMSLNVKTFIKRIVSYLLIAGITVWLIQNIHLNVFSAALPDKSVIQVVSEFLLPAFKPLGFDNWGTVACLIAGVLAKEMIVVTMGLINGTGTSVNSVTGSLIGGTGIITFNSASAVSFMVFALLYTPCVMTFAMFRREIGLKQTLIAAALQFAVSYFVTFAVYSVLIRSAAAPIFFAVLAVILLVPLIIKKSKSESMCLNCSGVCKNCGQK